MEESQPAADQLPRVLVADDHPQTVRGCRTALEGLFDLTVAGTLREAVRVVSTAPPSVIVLDADLGGGNVVDFCSSVRGGTSRRPIPVLLLIPPRFPKQTLRTLRTLCDGQCLFKPFHVGDLRARVRSLVAAAKKTAEQACPVRGMAAAWDIADEDRIAEVTRLTGDRLGSIMAGCKIERVLGRGASGAVYLARHLVLDVPVALKIMPVSVAQWGAEEVERFMRGARAAARVQHPNVVPVLNAGEEDGFCFLVQQYVEGETLKAKIEAQGRLDEESTIRMLREIASGLGVVHRFGTVHRDVKPGNIMITPAGTAVLTDFGLARPIGRSESSSTYLTGTPYYMSPEQCEGLALDGRCDLYSLGAAAYHALTGRLPIEGNTPVAVLRGHLKSVPPPPREIQPQLSEGISGIVLKLLAKNPNARHQTAEDLIEDLGRLTAGKTPT